MKEPLMDRLCDWLAEEIEDSINRHREGLKGEEANLSERIKDVERNRHMSEDVRFTSDLRDYYARCVERANREIEHTRDTIEQDKRAVDKLLLPAASRLKEASHSFWSERKQQWQESSKFWQQLE